ncbi:hypothetical protein IAR50_007374 [Cryptococcus sp. DSM 104548]
MLKRLYSGGNKSRNEPATPIAQPEHTAEPKATPLKSSDKFCHGNAHDSPLYNISESCTPVSRQALAEWRIKDDPADSDDPIIDLIIEENSEDYFYNIAEAFVMKYADGAFEINPYDVDQAIMDIAEECELYPREPSLSSSPNPPTTVTLD